MMCCIQHTGYYYHTRWCELCARVLEKQKPCPFPLLASPPSLSLLDNAGGHLNNAGWDYNHPDGQSEQQGTEFVCF